MKVSTPDYFQYLQGLRKFMSEQPDLADYDMDGSALSFLSRALAYDATNQGFYNAMMFNELHSTAQIRENIGTLVQFNQYTPDSSHGSKCVVDIHVSPTNLSTAPPQITLTDTTRFSVTSDTQAFTMVPDKDYASEPITDGVYVFRDVTLIQGKRMIQTFDVEGEAVSTYTIPHHDIDIDTLHVYTTPSESNLTATEYKRFENVYDLTGSNAKVYYLELGPNNKYTLEFGDNVLSHKPDAGSVVFAKYLITDGEGSNGLSKITPTMSIDGYTNITIKVNSNTRGGQSSENADSIRRNAKRRVWTGGTAISPEDYEDLIREVSGVKDVRCWGGEDNIPPKNGVMFASVIDSNNSITVSDQLKSDIRAHCDGKHLGSIFLNIVDSDILYIDVTSKVSYDPRLSSADNEFIVSAVRSKLLELSDSLGQFNSMFDMSVLTDTITHATSSIVGNVTDVSYRKAFNPILNVRGSYLINFNKQLAPNSILIDQFNADQGTLDTLRMIDKGDGILHLQKQRIDQSWLDLGAVGTVDYTSGSISISSFKFTGVGSSGVQVSCKSGLIDRDLTNTTGVYLTIGNMDIQAVKRKG